MTSSARVLVWLVPLLALAAGCGFMRGAQDMSGTVAEVGVHPDGTVDVLVVVDAGQDSAGSDATVHIREGTELKADGATTGVDDLKAGRRIAVWYRDDLEGVPAAGIASRIVLTD